MAGSQAYGMLHELVKKWVYNQKWKEFRPIQEQSIGYFFQTDNHIVISANTAGGKTEAAFLPVFSDMVSSDFRGIQCLCISPLKALIDDQYRRLRSLGELCDIPVHRWHGDVPGGIKKKIRDKPEGVLFITPESLEALFVNHGSKINFIFSGLRYVVIDELHVFLNSERGIQLKSLLNRLQIVLGRDIRIIALSATIGDLRNAAFYVSAGQEGRCSFVTDEGSDPNIRLKIFGYSGSKKKKDGDVLAEGDHQIGNDLFAALRGSTNLIFANSRQKVEFYGDFLRRKSEQLAVPQEFHVHHANLSRQIRKDLEQDLQKKRTPKNVVCTSTLELGIDIGSIRSIAQVGCPPGVSSLKQRLGRSGRNSIDPSIMRIYMNIPAGSINAPLEVLLRSELFQTIAMVELMREKWVEPERKGSVHFSTLIQQLLSLIAQTGGVTAKQAWERLRVGHNFGDITQKQFITLLRSLGELGIVDQMDNNLLVAGEKGEVIIGHYSFYAAFQTPEEYKLYGDGKALGTLPVSGALTEGHFIIFSGKRWKIVSIDDEKKCIYLTFSHGGKLPDFDGAGFTVHDVVRKKMFDLYQVEEVPFYLNERGRELFLEGRDHFRRLGLAHKKIVNHNGQVVIFPWYGDRVLNTLLLLLHREDFGAVKNRMSIEIIDTEMDQVIHFLQFAGLNEEKDLIDLAGLCPIKKIEKYDHFVPDELLCFQYARNYLDLENTKLFLRDMRLKQTVQYR